MSLYLYGLYTLLGVVNFKSKIMNIKIDAVEGISLKDQLQITSDYIELFFGKPKETKQIGTI